MTPRMTLLLTLFISTAALAQESMTESAQHTVGLILVGLAVPVVGYLLNRSIVKNDESIKELDVKLQRFIEGHNETKEAVAVLKSEVDRAKIDVNNLGQLIRGGGVRGSGG